MKSESVRELLKQVALQLRPESAYSVFVSTQSTTLSLREWYSQLNAEAAKLNLFFSVQALKPQELLGFAQTLPVPPVVFAANEPLFVAHEGGQLSFTHLDGAQKQCSSSELLPLREFDETNIEKANDILVLVAIQLNATEEHDETLSPFKRFLNLISEERKNIYLIYIYAILGGLLGLTLPLGVQSVVSIISGGLFLRPVVLLSIFVVLGVLLTGVMQIMQMTIVENVQQRIFTRTAIDFAFRIPRIKMEKLLKVYEPELVNRFFDVLTIQKGLTKILVDLITALLQIIFGLLLLSLYHPLFIFFGIFLLSIMFLLFYFTGKKGLQTSLHESKYKYAIAHWLEELGRNIITFKIAGNSPLPLQKLEKHLAGYLGKRRAHFQVLLSQFRGFVFFKTGIVGGLLVLGSFLVIDRQISVGQFVAAELVIVLVISAIEKLILHLDNIYDVLTAVEKLGNLTDLPLEDETAPLMAQTESCGYAIEAKSLNYKYPDATKRTLHNVNLRVNSGESIAIIGREGSGKTTLMYVLAGILESYEGQITFNGNSLRDLNKRSLRDRIGDSLSHEHIFEGTLLENITLNRGGISTADIQKVLKITELDNAVNEMPDGLQTPLVASGKGMPSSTTKKIILARSLLAQPGLVVFDDFFFNLQSAFKARLFKKLLVDKELACTFIISSHDPIALQYVDNIYLIDEGTIVLNGKYSEIKNNKELIWLL
ncbi:ATP-binding cassette domain-containing protein [bacterium]|nr:ATP-binding cassette domain-containing protein [bacterium]